MKKLALSAGHYPAKKGASVGSFNEHDEAVIWVEQLELLLTGKVQVVPIPTGPLWKKLAFINKQSNIGLAIEIHFNSASGKVRGCETLFYPGSEKGIYAAQLVQTELAKILPPDRGIKPGWYRMDLPGRVDFDGDIDGDETIDAFLRKTYCTAIIIEAEFIQNKEKIQSNRFKACTAIAHAIVTFLEV